MDWRFVFVVGIVGVVVWWYMRRGVCDRYWKYKNLSIEVSHDETYACGITKVPGYCVVEFDEGVELCSGDEKCIGFITRGGDVQLISKQPTNYGQKTDVIYYEKK